MKNFTSGSIPSHVLRMAIPIALGMVLQASYQVVDLFFISKLGAPAVAGVGTATTLSFALLCISQAVSAGVVSLTANALGAGNTEYANTIFNQSVILAVLLSILSLVLGYTAGVYLLRMLCADEASYLQGRSFLYFYLPALSLQFLQVPMAAALRASGMPAKPLAIQSLSVLVNILLAPLLIGGAGLISGLGTAGAGLATTVSVATGTVVMARLYFTGASELRFQMSSLRPQFAVWNRLMRIGVPAGAEFALMFVSSGFIYWLLRNAGSTQQAGFGTGVRIVQTAFLPIAALSFAVAPIIGQNIGAKAFLRARATYDFALKTCVPLMLLLTVRTPRLPRQII